ncbi:mechanosensitive ion channel [Cryobacterium sp. TMN-39-2]|uniref:Mechanosensitive ion channel protein MscS n=1 Tax=Cryobacterium zongtaii TaxID=1259217 RepID=A0A2S3ZN38_9MICO|nr:mechanosensitive ion channel protein MscS [Cryobacterium zongtaii]POH70335.1 mechanosensitive ion channel protein MscS [Cryobacterium zongtaii]TFC42280.1 mechanosensitive ion channel [Cryobacterium sp. TMN-39-2]
MGGPRDTAVAVLLRPDTERSLVIEVFGLSLPAFPVAVVAAIVLALAITAIAAFSFRMVGKRRSWARVLVKLIRVPFRMTVLIGALWLAVAGYLDVPEAWEATVGFVFRALFIGSATWLLCALLYYAEEITANKYRIDVRDNRVARRVRTQLRMLRRIGVVIIIICAIGTVLLSIPGAATVGASLFASAGLLSVVAGLAAQSTLANIFAGMQLAFNNALRVDDVVIVESEWGKIEEITLTYIVVHIWDDRRMVLPSTYFTTTPFQNWTRHNSELLGQIDFDLDWRVNPAAMRDELNRVVAQTDLWDGRAVVLQVTDAVGGFVRVRVLVTAQDAPTLFDLRCFVRENLIDWVNAENPDALPLNRVEVRQQPETPPVRPSSHSRKPARPVIEAPGLFSGDEGGKERAQHFTESITVQDWEDAPETLPAPR